MPFGTTQHIPLNRAAAPYNTKFGRSLPMPWSTRSHMYRRLRPHIGVQQVAVLTDIRNLLGNGADTFPNGFQEGTYPRLHPRLDPAWRRCDKLLARYDVN